LTTAGLMGNRKKERASFEALSHRKDGG